MFPLEQLSMIYPMEDYFFALAVAHWKILNYQISPILLLTMKIDHWLALRQVDWPFDGGFESRSDYWVVSKGILLLMMHYHSKSRDLYNLWEHDNVLFVDEVSHRNEISIYFENDVFQVDFDVWYGPQVPKAQEEH